MILARLAIVVMVVALCVTAPFTTGQSVATPAAQSTSGFTAGSSLDFNVYRTSIEPIFLKDREGGVMCYACHSTLPTRLRLQPMSLGSTSWTEGQSHLNFEAVSQLVTPGDPLKSRLLLHPLAPEAGGDPTHTGGKFWRSQSDPEWQMIAEWVRAGSSGSTAAPASSEASAPSLDFQFFEARVEPIFLKKRADHTLCYSCHSINNSSFRLVKLSPGSTSWTEEQSRRNFQNVSQLVVPGDPTLSVLLMRPLAPEAGGYPFHSGGRQFESKNDPDWLTLAEWVRGRKTGGSSGHAANNQ
jgi:hypothetical protein